uniref:Uncharacterized protein n=1 Tax=Chromera velia CCMP2878 TaxID=1169474 RepID=A0A0G4HHV5_9ALVE|mmetsp:Transcript_53031/g.103757  ORF Transcript_53031/g.103757 Transcript_53031/m.103757 type:complete len:151 (-) Transcript_53031:784-1236(-)|eukprot:Cvel_27729.t1-p1 / transcript=Cvel_27729.t1 / gene=Cvel_27729 / organism=Chromera_velia_CCMP2878 / gene_product=hypothetical protein / transcript_product=hypothetical protein / location=Cvel_scaffold3509:5365-5814(+) / protein_length=150 / sequence_SO=supercontig / SO=protein_coding / is_pseudo=false
MWSSVLLCFGAFTVFSRCAAFQFSHVHQRGRPLSRSVAPRRPFRLVDLDLPLSADSLTATVLSAEEGQEEPKPNPAEDPKFQQMVGRTEITRDTEPDEYFKTAWDEKSDIDKLKSPFVWVTFGFLAFPFLIAFWAYSSGYLDSISNTQSF